MEMEPPIISATSEMAAAANNLADDEPGMAMIRTMRNNNVVHHLLPAGFQPCPHNHVCPSCSSTLILKPPSKGQAKKTRSSINFLESNLESAHSANMLLQALSFDAATRDERHGLEHEQIAEGISYCPDCRVHVITSAEELERLFEEYDNGNNEQGGGGSSDNMEWLRGSLLVAVDDAEVMALEHRNGDGGKPAPQHWSPSLLGHQSQASEVFSAHDTLPRHLQPKPTRPMEFDYEYRHKVATHSMASRISRGYTLLDEICPECEMPLMKIRDMKECVVCPKLIKKISKYHNCTIDGQLPNDRANNQRSVQRQPPVDPISAIIAQARSEAPQQYSSRTRRTVQPDIAEAKQYVMQRRIMNSGPSKSKTDRDKSISGEGSKIPGRASGAGSGGGCNVSEAGSHCTESMTDHTASSAGDHLGYGMPHNPINWEELLVNGRTILSKRLNEGWILSSTNCAGGNCNGTPLLTRLDGEHVDLDYCVVCGGSGNGEDEAYERETEWQALAAELAEKAEREARPDWEELAGNGRALLSERLKQGWTMSSENCCGYNCNEMPLTNIEGGPNSCVVCGGSGNGCDGSYENYKPDEVVAEERALVSQEISQLLSMGWVLRESLCAQCLMPLVAEDDDADEDLCILCGRLPENNPLSNHLDDDNDDVEDSYMNEEPSYDEDTLTQAVNEPVAIYGDDNTDEAGKRLIMGWTLPDAGLCHHCHGVLMSPPNSQEIGCINRGCSSALAAAYTFFRDPHESTGPVRLIGRGFSNPNKEKDERNDVQVEEEAAGGQLLESHVQKEPIHHRGNTQYDIKEQHNGPPLEIRGDHQGNAHLGGYDETSVLSDDMTQVRSVASSALGVILVRLDDAKYELEAMKESADADPQECAQKQVEIAMLIEKLASAAVQLKHRD